jgi:FkbM family methyltransferase
MKFLRPHRTTIKQITRAIVKDRSPTYARLIAAVAQQPRYTPGSFSFPFGTVQYVDGASLRGQYFELFMQREYDFVCAHTTPRIFDCGANVGLSVIAFKQRYPHSHITAFEADPTIAATLRTNLENLNLMAGVTVVQAAVWNQQGVVSFAADGADAGRISDQPDARAVPAVRLADYITDTVDMLKLDIEGAEYTVLQDLCDTGAIAHVQRIICEFHGWAPVAGQTGRLLEALHQAGFATTFTYARSAPDLPGAPEPTPFPAVQDGKYLLRMYAWK